MTNTAQRSFGAGEVAPAYRARTDEARYQEAVQALRNFVPMRTGGAQSRPGTEFIGRTKDDGPARLIDCVFDDTADFLLELGVGYVRFWIDDEQLQAVVAGAWATATPYTAGQVLSRTGVNYVCILGHTSGTSTAPGTGASWETAWYALEAAIYELPTPFLEADLPDIQYAVPEFNVMVFSHPDHRMQKLQRTTNTSWTFGNASFELEDGVVTDLVISGASGSGWGYTVAPYYADGSVGPCDTWRRTDITGTLAQFKLALQAASRTASFSSSDAEATRYRLYLSESDVSAGYYFDAYTGKLAVGTPIVVSLVYNIILSSGNPTFAEQRFNGAGDYPFAVGAFGQRLLLGGSANYPDGVYASRSEDPFNFYVSDDVVDGDSISWRQVGRQLNRVLHFRDIAGRLVVFSNIGETEIQGAPDRVLRPGEVNPRQISQNGCSKLPPLVIGDTCVYVQARGSVVRDLFPTSAVAMGGGDLTMLSAHLVDGYQLVACCYQQTPHSIAWFIRDDGVMLSLTYVRELGMLAWARHDLYLGTAEQVACVSSRDEDKVYVLVARTLADATIRCIERMDRCAAANPLFVDAAVRRIAPRLVGLGGDTAAEFYAFGGAVETPIAGLTYEHIAVHEVEYDIAEGTLVSALLVNTATPAPDPAFGTEPVAFVRTMQEVVEVNNHTALLQIPRPDTIDGTETASLAHMDLYCELKANGREIVLLSLGSGDYSSFYVDLSDGSVTTDNTGSQVLLTAAPIVTSLGGGWWSIRAGWKAPAASDNEFRLQLRLGTTAPGTSSYLGAGSALDIGRFRLVRMDRISIDDSTPSLAYALRETAVNSDFGFGTFTDLSSRREFTRPLAVPVERTCRVRNQGRRARFTENFGNGHSLTFVLDPATGTITDVVADAGIVVIEAPNTSGPADGWYRLRYSARLADPSDAGSQADLVVTLLDGADADIYDGDPDLGIDIAALQVVPHLSYCDIEPLAGTAGFEFPDPPVTPIIGLSCASDAGLVAGLPMRVTSGGVDIEGYLLEVVDGYGALAGQAALAFLVTSDITTDQLDVILADGAVDVAIGTYTVPGCAHLVGKSVAINADGVTIASPLNPLYDAAAPNGGGIVTLAVPAFDVQVGLPIVSDLQTLDIDSPSGRSVKDGAFAITRLGLYLEDTGALYCGQRAPADEYALSDGSYDLQALPIQDENGDATDRVTGYREVNVEGAYSPYGSILLRNVDPQPVTVLAIVAQGHFPSGG